MKSPRHALHTLLTLAAFSVLSAATALALSPSLSVTDTYNRHNLSASGPGTAGVTKAAGEVRVCIFCHTPHHATSITPLWSRDLSTAVYTPYVSTTLQALPRPGQPTGASRLCLSCHDGTIALSMLTGSKDIGGLPPLPATRISNLKTDLSDDHPISFAYASAVTPNSGLTPAAALPKEIRLQNGNLECTACHDPHRDLYPPASDPLNSGNFLVLDNSSYSALCVACHNMPGTTTSAHYTANQACEKCHVSHAAPQPQRLLKGATLQDTCLFNCHNGTPLAGNNVKASFSTAKAHQPGAVVVSGSHDANENPLNFISSFAHVECVDCHNPCLVQHATTPLSSPPSINGRLAYVTIVKAADGTRTFATKEYEVCFKCHAQQPFTPAAVPRQIQTGDESARFSINNPSYLPVTVIGKVATVASLRTQIVGFTPARTLSTVSMIYCTDCHNSNNSAKVGGAGATGPHGSTYRHLLLDRYEQDTYPLAYSDNNYALCYRCHDQNVLLNPALTTFPRHQSHLVTHQVPCSICHDPHGVPVTLGATATKNAHLINFDTRFGITGSYNSVARSCTVSCHTTGSPDPKTHTY